jgi:hypothetical protein
MLLWMDTDEIEWRDNRCQWDRDQDPDVSTDSDYGDGFVGVRIGVRGCTEYESVLGIDEVQTDNKRNEAGYAFNQVYGWAANMLPCGPYHIRPHLRVNGRVTLYSVATANNWLTSYWNKSKRSSEVYAGFELRSSVRVYYTGQVISSTDGSILSERVSANDFQSTILKQPSYLDNIYYLPNTEFMLEGVGVLQVVINIEMVVFTRGSTNRAYCHAIDNRNGLFRIETGGMQVYQCESVV